MAAIYLFFLGILLQGIASYVAIHIFNLVTVNDVFCLMLCRYTYPLKVFYVILCYVIKYRVKAKPVNLL